MIVTEKRKNIFLNKVISKYGTFFDLSKINFINYRTKVELICPDHGSFFKRPDTLLKNVYGCPDCAKIKQKKIKPKNKLNTEIIKKRLLDINTIYLLDRINYINSNTKIELVCKKHGSFWVLPREATHNGAGCQKCSGSKGERIISNFLDKNNFSYQREKLFEELGLLRFDFYLPNINTIIEFDGRQHFKPITVFGGESEFKKLIKNDKIKNNFCKLKNIDLIRIPYTKIKEIEEILIKELK